MTRNTKLSMFQSTHPRRVWRYNAQRFFTLEVFQSTHPRRVWLNSWTILAVAVDVSIHTPTKGVTCIQGWAIGAGMFQSTHPRRVWPSQLHHTKAWGQFQSTHPRRVWLNDRLRTELRRRFQSTHPRRVWLRLQRLPMAICKFQSTHPRRVWPFSPYYCNRMQRKVSIHTPTKGVTNGPCTMPLLQEFQSTHPRRVWHSLFSYPLNLIYVSIHTPTKGVT